MKTPLAVAGAFRAYGVGLTPDEHMQRYGFDLAWARVEKRQMCCDGCGARGELPADITAVQELCRRFVEVHARCVRVLQKARRAS